MNKSSFVSEVDENKVAEQKKVSKVSNEPLGKKLRNKMRANGNLILKITFFIMIAFYVFSFSSNYIFAPKEADLLYTPLKQDNPIDNLNVQINDWKYYSTFSNYDCICIEYFTTVIQRRIISNY